MNKLLGWSLVIGFVSVGSVYAGTKDGGGGPSVICNGPDGKVQSAQLLDLHEAQVRYGLTVPHSNTPAQVQLKAAFERLVAYNWFIASDVEDALSAVESKIAFLPAGEIMAPGVDLGDGYAAVIPNGCSLAYVGYYESDGTLRISKDIFDLLSETDRAALLMHEALYKVARDIGYQKDSLVSRKFNGYLFSTAQDLSSLDGDAPELSYASRFRNVAQPVQINSPVVLPGSPQNTLTLTETGLNSGVGVNFFCISPDGDATNLYPLFAADGTIHLDIGNCRAFKVSFGDYKKPFTFNAKYGDDIIDSEQPKYSGSNDTYEISSLITVYFQRPLQIPVGPQF
jgi:hypothetical protein